MWGSWAGRVREVKGEIPGVLVCGAGEREWVSELLACLGGGVGEGGSEADSSACDPQLGRMIEVIE